MGLFNLANNGPVDPAVEIAAINRREAAAALRRYAIPMSPNSPERYCLFAIIDTLYKRGVDVQEVLVKHLNAEYDAAEEKLQAKSSSAPVLGDHGAVDVTAMTDTVSELHDAATKVLYAPTFDENGFYCG